MAQRCVRDPVLMSSPGRCASHPGAIDLRTLRFGRRALEGVWGTARTEVPLGDSPHFPGAGCTVPPSWTVQTPASTAATSGTSTGSGAFARHRSRRRRGEGASCAGRATARFRR
jgi:hypothetical protein